jgi:hypothetical protein
MKERELILDIKAISSPNYRYFEYPDIIDFLIEGFNTIEQEELYYLFNIINLRFYNNYIFDYDQYAEKIIIDTSKYTDIKYVLENDNKAYLECSTTTLSKFNKKELFNDSKIIVKKSLYDTLVSIVVTKYLAKTSPHFVNTYGIKFADITHVSYIDKQKDYTVTIRSHNIKDERKAGIYHYQEYLTYPTLAELIKDINLKQLVNYYYQLLLLITSLQEEYTFTHHNCTCHNIYIKKLDYMTAIEYYVDKKYYNLSTNEIIVLNNYKDVTITINAKLKYEYIRTFNYFEDILSFLQSIVIEAKKYQRQDILTFVTIAAQYFDDNVDLQEDLRFLIERKESNDMLDYLEYFTDLQDYQIQNYNITIHQKRMLPTIKMFFDNIRSLLREYILEEVDVTIPENQILLMQNLQNYYTSEEIVNMDIYKLFYYDRYDKAIKFKDLLENINHTNEKHILKGNYEQYNDIASKVYTNALNTISLKNFNYMLLYFDQYYYINNSKYIIFRDDEQDNILKNVYKFITAWESLFNIKIKTYNDLRDLYISLDINGLSNKKLLNKYKQFLYFKEYCML